MHSRDASSTSSSDVGRAWLALGVPFVAVIAACIALLWIWREPLATIGTGKGAVERGLLRRLDVYRKKPALRPRILVMGDSLNLCSTPGQKKTHAVGPTVRATMTRAGRPVDMVDLTQPGLLPIHFYALLDDVLATPVALAVFEVNLRTFLNPNPRPAHERLPGLAGMLDFHEAIRLRAALAREGLSVFDPPLMRLKEQLGLLNVFEGAREAALDGLGAIASWATDALRLPQQSFGTGTFGEISRRASLSYLVDYAHHPNATVLRAAVEKLRAVNIPVIVYVAPVNVEFLRRKAGFDAGELERRLEDLRVSVGASPAEWLDLHAALPAERFRDYQNHLLFEGCMDVARPLAERALRRLAKHRAPPRPVSSGAR